MSIALDINTSKLPAGTDPCDFSIEYPDLIRIPENPRIIGYDKDGVPLTQTPRWEMALITAYIWNSVFNVDARFNNNTLSYSADSGSSWKLVTFPNGSYAIEDLNDEMHRQMEANNDFTTDPLTGEKTYPASLIPNMASMKTRIELDTNGQLDLSTGDLYTLLGWPAAVVTTAGEGPDYTDVTRGVDSYQIHVSGVNSGYDNSTAGDIIYTFNFQKKPGTQERFEPVNPIYLPLREKIAIQSIRIRVTDQRNRVANFNGDDIVLRLHIRRVWD